MAKKKQVLLINYEGHQYFPKYETSWSDTWVRFKKRKKTVRIGPTIVSLEDFLREQQWDEQFHNENPEFEKSRRPLPELPKEDWKFCRPWKEFLKWEAGGGTATIVVNGPVTKKSIEGSVDWFLRTFHGVTSPIRFRWKNHKKKFFVTPVGFSNFEEKQ